MQGEDQHKKLIFVYCKHCLVRLNDAWCNATHYLLFKFLQKMLLRKFINESKLSNLFFAYTGL